MIERLHGILAEATPTSVVIECHGVGYAVSIPVSSYDKLPAVGSEARLLTHQHFSAQDGAQQLYGFATAAERAMFLMLISISGVGPKLACNILSSASVSGLRAAIAGGDVKTLSALRGIGKKTAERLVVELKDKLAATTLASAPSSPASPADQRLTDAVLALISLGFKQADAQTAVRAARQAAPPDATVETLVRLALGAAS